MNNKMDPLTVLGVVHERQEFITNLLLSRLRRGRSLDATARANLTKKLGDILPGTERAKQSFVELADQAIFAFRRSDMQTRDRGSVLNTKLERMTDLAKKLGRTMSSMDGSTRTRIAAWLYFAKKVNSKVAGMDEHLTNFEADLRIVVEAADANRIPGSRQYKPSDRLIRTLAVAYGIIFGTKPGSSKRGTFWKAVRAIFEAADISERPDEKRLGRILATRLIPGGRPRRGRRPQN